MQINDLFQEHNTKVLLEKITTNQFSSSDAPNVLFSLVKRLYNNKDIEKIMNMISSNDEEVFLLGTQLLFDDYIEWYNVISKNLYIKTMLHQIVKLYNNIAYETNEN